MAKKFELTRTHIFLTQFSIIIVIAATTTHFHSHAFTEVQLTEAQHHLNDVREDGNCVQNDAAARHDEMAKELEFINDMNVFGVIFHYHCYCFLQRNN